MPVEEYVNIRREVMDVLRRVIQAKKHGFNEVRSEGVSKWIDTLSDSFLNTYLRAIRESPDSAYDELFLGVISARDSEEVALRYFAIAALDPQILPAEDDYGRGNGLYRRAKSISLGFEQYVSVGYVPPKELLNTSEQDVAAALGLVRLTHRLADGGDSGIGLRSDFTREFDHFMYISSEPLIEIVLKRPEDADRIADFVLERETVDPELISDYLNAPAASLSAGIL